MTRSLSIALTAFVLSSSAHAALVGLTTLDGGSQSLHVIDQSSGAAGSSFFSFNVAPNPGGRGYSGLTFYSPNQIYLATRSFDQLIPELLVIDPFGGTTFSTSITGLDPTHGISGLQSVGSRIFVTAGPSNLETALVELSLNGSVLSTVALGIGDNDTLAALSTGQLLSADFNKTTDPTFHSIAPPFNSPTATPSGDVTKTGDRFDSAVRTSDDAFFITDGVGGQSRLIRYDVVASVYQEGVVVGATGLGPFAGLAFGPVPSSTVPMPATLALLGLGLLCLTGFERRRTRTP